MENLANLIGILNDYIDTYFLCAILVILGLCAGANATRDATPHTPWSGKSG